jgi:putative SOS response-associated peptidase YedK
MCYAFSLLEPDAIAFRYAARFPSDWEYQPMYYMNAFSLPEHPILTNDTPNDFQMMYWGLIPFWVKKYEDAESIRTKTMNARAESLFEKPSFKYAIKKRRCLIPADGFFEWRYHLGKNYPYYIQLKNHEIFSFAGIWERWKQPDEEKELFTFCIITCEANSLLATIHNKKKRMPVILPKEVEKQWIQNDLSEDEIIALLNPYPDEKMDAYTISKFITGKDEQKNVKKVIEPYHFPELPPI